MCVENRIGGKFFSQSGRAPPNETNRQEEKPNGTENGIFMIKYEILYSMFSRSRNVGAAFPFFFLLLPPLCRNKRVRRTHMYVRERKKVDFYKRKHMHIYSGSELWEQWLGGKGGGEGGYVLEWKKIIFYYYFIHYVYPHT